MAAAPKIVLSWRASTLAVLAAGLYFVCCAVYLWLSTTLAARAALSVPQLESVELLKGMLFVLLSAILFGLIVFLALKRLASAREHASSLESALVVSDRRALIGQFAAAVAHDMNNLITVVQNTIVLFESGGEDDRKKYADLLNTAANSLKELGRQLQHMGNRGASDEIESRNPADLVRRIVALAESHPKLEFVKISVEAAGSPAACRLRPVIFQQMLGNLLLNAADSMKGHGKVLVRLTQHGDSITLEVHDSGPGVPSDLVDSIFDPFYSTKGEEGSGLGLLSVKAAANMHDGNVLVSRSPELGGAFFKVSMRAC